MRAPSQNEPMSAHKPASGTTQAAQTNRQLYNRLDSRQTRDAGAPAYACYRAGTHLHLFKHIYIHGATGQTGRRHSIGQRKTGQETTE